jgi:hypothetical protein
LALDGDTTLTHTDGVGLTLNGTNKLTFGDAASFVQQSGDGVLRIDGEATIDLNASTKVDVSAALDVGTDLTVGDDIYLDSDAAVLHFGDDGDVTLTHVASTGLLLNSTMALQFNDASQYINAPSATVLDITADAEIELNATLVDVNANLDVSGTTTLGDTLTVNAGAVFNEASADVDFRVESNGQANMLFVDAGNDRVGIKQASPGIGGTSGNKLELIANGSVMQTINTDGTVAIGADYLNVADGITTIGGTDTSQLRFLNAAGTLRSFLTLNSTSLEIDTDSTLIFSPNNAERARIDASGRFGIGTASPSDYYSGSNKFVVANTGGGTGMSIVTNNTSAGRIDFAEGTSGAEQYRGTVAYQHAATEASGYLRLESTGFLRVKTGGFVRLRVEEDGITCIGRESGDASTVTGHQFYQSGAYYNYHDTGEVVRWYNTSNGNDVGSIDISTTATAYNTSSDRRLKENIETSDPSGSLIDSIEIVKHDWISSDNHVRYGVVAQDLFEVLPEAVSQGTGGDLVDGDLVDDESSQPIKQVWGVDYSKLVPLLVKEVQDLRIRVTELEA